MQVPSICPLTSTKPSAVTPVVVSEDVIPESDWVPSPLNLTTNRSLPGLAPTPEIPPPCSQVLAAERGLAWVIAVGPLPLVARDAVACMVAPRERVRQKKIKIP